MVDAVVVAATHDGSSSTDTAATQHMHTRPRVVVPIAASADAIACASRACHDAHSRFGLADTIACVATQT